MTKTTPSVEDLASLYVLDSINGFGPQKMKLLHDAGIEAAQVLREPGLLPIPGKRGDMLRAQLAAEGKDRWKRCFERAEKQISIARETSSSIITYQHPAYPKHVFESNNPTGILYVRGPLHLLSNLWTVACVGSRGIREPYARFHADFARTAARLGFTVISGFALGADTVGHKAAMAAGGHTVCVMPSGLDRPFPPENKLLWRSFLEGSQAVFVSEFPFGTGANSLNLRKRNKLIVAFAQGVLVSQSSDKGGAMNAYRFALEQRKPVATFEQDQTSETSGNALIAAKRIESTGVFASDLEADHEYTRWLLAL